ncbi:MAG: M1 family metallopeptidase [Bacteroidetes bacterium]|nr:M1 family metallopeptidase [Bacteroidota bacterium]
MFWKATSILLFFSFLTLSCSSPLKEKIYVKDSHSNSKPWEVDIEHISLNLVIDFDKKIISGKATLFINNKKGVDRLYLDAWGLKIDRITLGKAQSPTTFVIGKFVKFHGSPLVVDITAQTKTVNIYYSTSPDAEGLDWVTPEQTAGGVYPFLYTQSQAILARTWIPLQDTPGVRFSYDATIKVPSEFLAVMSAGNPTEKNAEGIYHFEMPQKIPSYLMALGVGDLEFRSLGPRTGVYVEPSLIDKAEYEFADTEVMMTTAEKLYGPYLWDRYDLLVLPSSFPWGGMENPRLTFVYPLVLVGDRSLVSLVAHELAHSWSGNLVTNANWDDVWLNEGFTTYLTGRIMEEVYGESYENMLKVKGEINLREEIDRMGPDSSDTRLKLNMEGRNPDDAFSTIPYQKGRFFLMTVEKTVGRERWDTFLHDYFQEHAFGNMTTEGFLQYMNDNLLMGNKELGEKIQIENWVYGKGLPSNFPELHSEEFDIVDDMINNWVKGSPASEISTEGWTTHHWIYFLKQLPVKISKERLNALNTSLKLNDIKNPIVLRNWLSLAMENLYEPAYETVEKFLIEIGNRSSVRQIYRAMAKTPEGLEMGRRIYKNARPRYHYMTTTAIDAILGWEEM